jgi:hypothetical protein
MWSCVASLLCVAAFVATTFARPSSQSADIDELARAYARLHPNTELDGNPEYGEYFEGDILGRDKTETRDEGNPLNVITDPDRLWPDGIIYYTILTDGYTSDEISKIEAGIADLVELTKVNGQTCVQILPRQSEADYVYVEDYSGCSSYVGRIEGPQQISLESGCVTAHGTIMHEFLHAFGFEHEHNRFDRDDWITVNWDNIQPGMEYAFDKTTPPEYDLLGTSYDYGSVLHYGPYGFAIDPSIPTIIPHDPNAEIGQRVTLSALDIERVQILYGCLNAADSRFFKHLDQKWIPKRI